MGIINLLGFWIGGVAGAVYIITSIFGIITFWVEGFQPTQWQVYLAYMALVLLSRTLPPIHEPSPNLLPLVLMDII